MGAFLLAFFFLNFPLLVLAEKYKTCEEYNSFRHIAAGENFGLLKPINHTTRKTCVTLCQDVSYILRLQFPEDCHRAFDSKIKQCRLLNLPKLTKAIRKSANAEEDSRITVPYSDFCRLLCERHPYCYAAETRSVGRAGYYCNFIHRSNRRPNPSKICERKRCTTFICEKTDQNLLIMK